jgi:hypothetical protein
MGSKTEATICGLGNGDRRVVVGHLDEALAALHVEAGIPDPR